LTKHTFVLYNDFVIKNKDIYLNFKLFMISYI